LNGENVSTGVLVWWGLLTIFGIIGIILWLATARAFLGGRGAQSATLFVARRRHLALSGVYALGCCFRAMLPRADVQRICLYDSWLSSVMLGRSVATVAELAFAAQWALMLSEASHNRHGGAARFASRVVVPMIAVAEVFSWYAVITTNFIGNAIEQSLWMAAVALLTFSLVRILPAYTGELRKLVLVWVAFGTAFVLFICFVDVPMYVTRWQADQAAGRTYLSLQEGLHDLNVRWIVTRAWEPWKDEMAWMALYFSAAVWLSISLVRSPWLGSFVREDKRQAI
jgi:hypothetical protein